MDNIKQLTALAKKITKIQSQNSRLHWVHYTTGYDFGVQKSYKKMTDVFKDKRNYELIKQHQTKKLSPLDRRRVDILERHFKPYHLSNELNELDLRIQEKTTQLSHILNTHRSKIDGVEVSTTKLAQILSESSDRSLRKKAFLAKNQVNQPLLDAGFIELVKMRKEFARLYGAKSFVDYQLKQQELDIFIFDSWLDEVKKFKPLSKKIISDFGERFINDQKVHHWDFSFISGQIAPEMNARVNMLDYYNIVRNFMLQFGFDIANYNITYDIFNRKNKSEWGYNFPIEAGVDSRILANVQDRFYDFGVLLHETGHAIHSFTVDPADPIMIMGINGIITEGIANLFDDMLTHKLFFRPFFENNLAEAEKHFQQLSRWKKALSLHPVNNIMLDQAFYLNPIEHKDDINQLCWKFDKEVMDLEPYDAEPVWAQRIHFTTHPIYLHNYFMGDVTCEMLKQVFEGKMNLLSFSEKPKEFGQFVLEEVIKPAGAYSFLNHFKRISGEDFSLKYLIQ